MTKCIIIANGQIDDYKVIKSSIDNIKDDDTIIVAADGGSKHLDNLGIEPDYIVGDLDSSDAYEKLKDKFKSAKFMLFDAEKDYTDMELAIETAKQSGAEEIYIYGCLGNRMDHTFGNVLLLKYMHDNNIKGYIIDELNCIEYLSNEEKVIKTGGYKYFSFVPIEGDVKSITLIDMKYPLNEKYVDFGSTLGISNEILGDSAKVILKESSALIFRSKDRKL